MGKDANPTSQGQLPTAETFSCFEAVLNSEFIAIVVVKGDHIVFANGAMHRMFGYDAGELTGKSARVFFLDEADFLRLLGDVDAAIAANKVFKGMAALKNKAEGVGWYEFNVSSLAGHPGMSVGAIIEQSADNESLRQLEINRTVLQDQTEVISRFLPDGTFTYVNDSFCRIFGKRRADLLGHQWQPVAHPDDLPTIEAKLGELSPGNPVVTIENRVYVSGGEERWMQFINRAIHDDSGRIKEIQAVGRDITAMKNIEMALRFSEQRLMLSLAASGLELWDWNIPASKVSAGEGWTELLGYLPEELGEEENAWKGLIHPDDRELFEMNISSALNGDTPDFESEHRLRHKDGHWIHVMAYGRVVVRDSAGNPLRMVGTVQDISHRRRLNEEGTRLLTQIETLIRESTQSKASLKTTIDLHEKLTKREHQVLVLIAKGMSSAQIARQLNVATNTVISHRQKMMEKLDLHRTAEVVRFAADHGLLNGESQ